MATLAVDTGQVIIVDERLCFNIFRHGPRGYIANRKQSGSLKSAVFGKSFRLTQQADAPGDPQCTLHVRG